VRELAVIRNGRLFKRKTPLLQGYTDIIREHYIRVAKYTLCDIMSIDVRGALLLCFLPIILLVRAVMFLFLNFHDGCLLFCCRL
jgi:hypothetical protein